MDTGKIFPYIDRPEFRQKVESALSTAIERDKQFAILIYGNGGTGKTSFLRDFVNTSQIKNVIWIGPYDMDDPQYWIFSNLAQEIASILDPSRKHFLPYWEFLIRVPKFEQSKVGHETVISKLREGDSIFFDCYRQCIEQTKQIPILVFDTIEAMRGLDIFKRLLDWLSKLERGYFILAGRPPLKTKNEDLQMFEKIIPHSSIPLGKFSLTESTKYLRGSVIGDTLTDDDTKNLAFLCDYSPLLLALTIDNLTTRNLTVWSKDGTEDFQDKKLIEWVRQKTKNAKENHIVKNEFIHRLLVPYRSKDFWPEAVKRMAIIRRRIDKGIWIDLMHDRTLPEEIKDWNEAWEIFRNLPWVRQRSNGREVTLHDVLAEQLAHRVIPLEDENRTWRIQNWKNAIHVYDKVTISKSNLLTKSKEVFEQISTTLQPGADAQFNQAAIELDVATIDLFLLKSTQLFYRLLVDFESGVQSFINLFDEAYDQYQYRFIDLMWFEIERFLPKSQTFDLLHDITHPVIKDFWVWYRSHPAQQYEIGRRISKYLINTERPQPSIELLSDLLRVCKNNPAQEYELYNLRGNAYLRTQGGAKKGGTDFKKALTITKNEDVLDNVRKREGHALTELGYYFRQIGRWSDAGGKYREALEIVPNDQYLAQASIQSQYAYVQALRGRYADADRLIQSAIAIRRKRGADNFIGMALSVEGEVYRYMRRFNRAWKAYTEAETIFERMDIPGWLGLVRQEMAICLLQASKEEDLTHVGTYDSKEKMLERAQELALSAVGLCQTHSVRALPSALNRAGRIIAVTNPDLGLKYLIKSVDAAKEVTDLWFYFASLVEYAELCYDQFEKTRDDKYRQLIETQRIKLDQARQELEFPDLQGRWEVIQGHLKTTIGLKYLESKQNKKAKAEFDNALPNYIKGYRLITIGYQASHGAAALRYEMQKLSKILRQLPKEEMERWFEKLNTAWSSLTSKEDRKLIGPLKAELNLIHSELD